MKRDWAISRRHFLGFVGAAGLPRLDLLRRQGQCQERQDPNPSTSTPELPILVGHQAEVLEALVEQIVPADSDPGALEAGVLGYINRVLAGDQSSKVPLYVAGIDGVDQTSQLMFSRSFLQLSFEEQTIVLKAIEHGQGPGEIWKTISSQVFFEMLWNHVLEGFYGPPEEGGNKNYASWKMIGFPQDNM